MDKEIGKEYTSVVAKVTANGVDKHASGLLYKYEYEMQDGTVLSARHKSEHNKLPEGEDAVYVIRGRNDYGQYGGVQKPFNGDRGNGASYTPTNNTPIAPNNKDKSIVWQSLAKVSASLLSNQSTANPDQLVEVTDFLVTYHDWTVAGKQDDKPVFNKPRVAADMPF